MLPASIICIQYTRNNGIYIGQDGKLRPGTMDEVEQTYGQRTLENVLCASPAWWTVEQPAFPAAISIAFEPLPELHPITTAVRKFNWSALGLAEPVNA